MESPSQWWRQCILATCRGRAERPKSPTGGLSSAPEFRPRPTISFPSLARQLAHTPGRRDQVDPTRTRVPSVRMITYSSGTQSTWSESWKSSEFITTKIAFTSRSAATPQERLAAPFSRSVPDANRSVVMNSPSTGQISEKGVFVQGDCFWRALLATRATSINKH
jgi:hypothetical protein